MRCLGGGCDYSGTLHTRVEDCDEDVAFYGDRSLAVPVLDTSTHFTFAFENVEDGLRCVQVFLDVDSSGNLSAGDVLSATAIDEGMNEPEDEPDDDTDDDPEIDVFVEKDEIVSVDVVLNVVLPSQL